MLDSLTQLLMGLGIALEPTNLAVALLGAILGTAVGVLPGLGPSATVSLLLPVTMVLDQTSAIILLAGIYYGSQYGGSITSVLMRVPGEASSVMTCFDGYPMARQGRAGAALGISAFGSFIAGISATLAIAIVGPAFTSVALAFGPVEKASIVLLGLVLAASIGGGSRAKAWTMVALGLLLSTTGVDLISGEERFAFGISYLRDGFNIAVLAMGLFGVSEMLMMIERRSSAESAPIPSYRLRELLPTGKDWQASRGPIARGTVLGFFLGLLPGGGALVAGFASYLLEKKLSRSPERFGKGAIEGVAGPESANNAAAQASFIPMLCLGIPANAVIGIIMGALLMQNVVPGPQILTEHPELFWGIVASMLVGNAMLVVLNVPLIRIFVLLLRIPAAMMAPLIVLFCVIGAFSMNNSLFDVGVVIGCGVVAYGLRKAGFDLAPLLLAFLLGSLLEENLRQGLILGLGNPRIFVESPISLTVILFTVAILIAPAVRDLRTRLIRKPC
ncbi:tripartite tricarboxylate transporter permease [Rhizobium sp. LC145]|uniref:tripartite tricarboxylate transporter permease n=1 Tax=Rhizobium sp. LC145 TaxID=1120688 RepID=UPI000629FC6B|nr:tripartite tricarboxylate transporter permease [Rhizobium sp. LC145]KKX29411.1 transporter [Rhizobium sp. LC145]MDX3927948.1 tripartite tricarboxylate transporter permease [Shinella sp.]TKT69027.1 tripartite tricarboxylate transporter permease [Rhizobiaceae bacterium LC148]